MVLLFALLGIFLIFTFLIALCMGMKLLAYGLALLIALACMG